MEASKQSHWSRQHLNWAELNLFFFISFNSHFSYFSIFHQHTILIYYCELKQLNKCHLCMYDVGMKEVEMRQIRQIIQSVSCQPSSSVLFSLFSLTQYISSCCRCWNVPDHRCCHRWCSIPFALSLLFYFLICLISTWNSSSHNFPHTLQHLVIVHMTHMIVLSTFFFFSDKSQ